MPTRFALDDWKEHESFANVYNARDLVESKNLVLELETFFFLLLVFGRASDSLCWCRSPTSPATRLSLSANNIDIKMKCFSLSFHTDTGKSIAKLPASWLWTRKSEVGWKIDDCFCRSSREKFASFIHDVSWLEFFRSSSRHLSMTERVVYSRGLPTMLHHRKVFY